MEMTVIAGVPEGVAPHPPLPQVLVIIEEPLSIWLRGIQMGK